VRTRQISIRHDGAEIECSIPDGYIDKIEMGQLIQVIGIVKDVCYFFSNSRRLQSRVFPAPVFDQ
jgi:hypothetical protein